MPWQFVSCQIAYTLLHSFAESKFQKIQFHTVI